MMLVITKSILDIPLAEELFKAFGMRYTKTGESKFLVEGNERIRKFLNDNFSYITAIRMEP